MFFVFSQKFHDDETIDYCIKNGIQYESYFALKGCNQKAAAVTDAATNHNKTTVQVRAT